MKTIGLFAIDCMNYELVNRAIHISCENFNFDQITLFSDQKKDPSIPTIIIPKITSTKRYSEFVIKELHQYVNTDFALIIQWDGYIVNSPSWDKIFLEYDYIGAKWPFIKDKHIVGNGGFSLRSKYLLEAVATIAEGNIIEENEDKYISRTKRDVLEKSFGINFAPESIADIFSYERHNPAFATFGFHGFFNMWRHCSVDEMNNILDMLDKNHFSKQDYIELMTNYFLKNEMHVFKKMYKLIRSCVDLDKTFELFDYHNINRQLSNQMIYTGENT